MSEEGSEDSPPRPKRKIKKVMVLSSDSSSDSDESVTATGTRRKRLRVVSDEGSDSSGSSVLCAGVRRKRALPQLRDSDADSDTSGWATDHSDAPKPAACTAKPTSGFASDSSEGNSDKCSICLLRFTDQEVGTPQSCEHIFCLDCITEWSKNVNTCPVDRMTFDYIVVRACAGGRVLRTDPVKLVERRPSVEMLIVEDTTVCEVCGRTDNEESMLLCDGCDLGYHMQCLTPPLAEVPVDQWLCPNCDNLLSDVDYLFSGITEEDLPLSSRREHRASRNSRISRAQSASDEPSTSSGRRGNQLNSDNIPTTSRGSRTSHTTSIRTCTTRRKTSAHTNRRRTKRRRTKTVIIEYEVQENGKFPITKRIKRKLKKRKTARRKPRTAARRSHVRASVRAALQAMGGSVRPAHPASPVRGLAKQRHHAAIPAVRLFGDPHQIDYFSDQDDELEVSENASTAVAVRPTASILNTYRQTRRKMISIPSPPHASSAPDILSSILESQTLLHSKNSVVSITVDGSVNIKLETREKTRLPKKQDEQRKTQDKIDLSKGGDAAKKVPSYPGQSRGGRGWGGGYTGNYHREQGTNSLNNRGAYEANYNTGGYQNRQGNSYHQNNARRDDVDTFNNYSRRPHQYQQPDDPIFDRNRRQPPEQNRQQNNIPPNQRVNEQQGRFSLAPSWQPYVPPPVGPRHEPVPSHHRHSFGGFENPLDMRMGQLPRQNSNPDNFCNSDSLSGGMQSQHIGKSHVQAYRPLPEPPMFKFDKTPEPEKSEDEKSDSSLVIDTEKYDPTEPTNDDDSGEEEHSAAVSGPVVPGAPAVVQALAQTLGAESLGVSATALDSAVRAVLHEHRQLLAPRPASDDDDDGDCPNFSIYSATSVHIANTSADHPPAAPAPSADSLEDLVQEDDDLPDEPPPQPPTPPPPPPAPALDNTTKKRTEEELKEKVSKRCPITTNPRNPIKIKLNTPSLIKRHVSLYDEEEQDVENDEETSEHVDNVPAILTDHDTQDEKTVRDEHEPCINSDTSLDKDNIPSDVDKDITSNEQIDKEHKETESECENVESIQGSNELEKVSITPDIQEAPSTCTEQCASPAPSVSPAPPSVSPAPTSVSSAPPSVSSAPPSVSPAPPSVSPAPPSVSPAPPSVSPAPPSVSPAPPSVSPAPPSVSPTPQEHSPPPDGTPPTEHTPDDLFEKMTESISETEDERSYTPCLDENKSKDTSLETEKEKGIEGLDTEMISEDEGNEMFSDNERAPSEQSRASPAPPPADEEGEIVDKKKDSRLDDNKKKKKKDSKKEGKDKSKSKNKKGDVAFKKLSKSGKERNYRDKDKKRERRESSDGERERAKQRRKERRKDLERYDVRTVVSEKRRRPKDAFGRDVSPRARSPSAPRSEPRLTPARRSASRPRRSASRPRHSASGPRRSASRPRRSVSRLRRSASRPHRSASRPRRSSSRPRCSTSRPRRSTSRPRRSLSRPPRSMSRLRRSVSRARRSVSRARRSVSRARRSASPRRRLSAGPRGRRASSSPRRMRVEPSPRSASPRVVSPVRAPRRRRRSVEREKRAARRRSTERTRKRRRSGSGSKSPRPKPSKRKKRARSERSASRRRSPRRRSPRRRRARRHSATRSGGATPARDMAGEASPGSVDSRLLSPRTPPPEPSPPPPDDARREKRRRDPDRVRHRRVRDTAGPSKEVFTSGDNILVSVSFKEQERAESDERRERRRERRRRRKRAAAPGADAAAPRPVAIIDLERSPFRELTPSPRNVIVLSDSEPGEKEPELAGGTGAAPAPEPVGALGPKTPPSPGGGAAPAAGGADDARGPNTPPEPPESPDAYDPYEPTRSASASPGSPRAASPPRALITLETAQKTNMSADDVIDRRPLSPIEKVMALLQSTRDVSPEPPPGESCSAGGSASPPSAPPVPPTAAPPPAPAPAAPPPVRIVLPEPTRAQPPKLFLAKPSPIKSDPIKPMQAAKIARVGAASGTATATVAARRRDGPESEPEADSPYSPGSSDFGDLFEPPGGAAPRNTFDALLERPQRSRKNRSAAAKVPVKLNNKKGKTQVGVKIDEDNLKILDDLPSSAVEMQVKTKFLKKLNRQERVVEEVKLVLKPHYNKKHVTKEEYKDILRRAVPKICHNKTGEINPSKIQTLVEAYVKKFRKKHKLGLV